MPAWAGDAGIELLTAGVMQYWFDDLIEPFFVCEGSGVRQEISSMPGVHRLSIDYLVPEVKACYSLGIPALPWDNQAFPKDNSAFVSENEGFDRKPSASLGHPSVSLESHTFPHENQIQKAPCFQNSTFPS